MFSVKTDVCDKFMTLLKEVNKKSEKYSLKNINENRFLDNRKLE